MLRRIALTMPFPRWLHALAALIVLSACGGSDDNGTDDDDGTGGTMASSTTGSGGGNTGGLGGTGGMGQAGAGGQGGAGGSAQGGAGGQGGMGQGGAGGSAQGGAGGQGGMGQGTGGQGAGGQGGQGGGGVNNTPCVTGPGWALWRLSWPPNSAGYATVNAWDNGCTYSLADQACSLSGEPHDYADFGPGVEFDSSTDFFRVRYSVQGLSFTTATLYISAHADGSGIPNGILTSPIYGTLSWAPTVPISQHKTYAIDWSAFLSPSDPPSLTAVTLESQPIGLAVSFMELCVQ